jgi:hypothetical protein
MPEQHQSNGRAERGALTGSGALQYAQHLVDTGATTAVVTATAIGVKKALQRPSKDTPPTPTKKH